jgi:cell wall assembly regulator SMI1
MKIYDAPMRLDETLKACQLNAGASEDAIRAAVSSLGCPLPADYLEFLRQHNGGEGFLGNHYVILWQAEELSAFNEEYEVNQYAPGLVLFGSSGGGEGYAFDTREKAMPVVQVPFIGMDLRYAKPIAASFTQALLQLANDAR